MRFNKGGRFRAECRLYMECKFDSFAPPGFQIFEKTSAAKIKAMKELLSKNRMVDVTPSNGNVCYNNWKAKQVSTRGTQEECEKKCLLDVNCKFMIYNPEGRKDCETLDEECDFKARAGNSVVFKKEPASPEETPEETPEEIPEEKPAPPKKAPPKKAPPKKAPPKKAPPKRRHPKRRQAKSPQGQFPLAVFHAPPRRTRMQISQKERLEHARDAWFRQIQAQACRCAITGEISGQRK